MPTRERPDAPTVRRDRSRASAGRRSLVAIALVAVLLAPLPVLAQESSFFNDLINGGANFITANVIYPVVQLLGNLLVALINILVAVASYNNFVNAAAVEKGFTIVRDVANMFFIVVLLVIAFGTILNIQTYRYNRLLGRLVIMAFLVNFARFIAGVFIDVGQLVMLTFVNAFRTAAAGNLTSAFGIEELLELRNVPANDISGYTIVGAVLLALALVLIAVIVVGVYVVVLLIRIIALWLLVVLSPIAFVLRTFPAGQKYAAQWWSNFQKYVVCGPVIAFFLWLSLTVIAVSNDQGILNAGLPAGEQVTIGGEVSGGAGVFQGASDAVAGSVAATISKISSADNLLSYMVAILLLLGSLMIAQEICGRAGSFAGQWVGRAGRAASFVTGVTAAGTILARGRRGVGRSWEVAKAGVSTAAKAPFGLLGRTIQERIPWANPANFVRGWRKAREEQQQRISNIATAKGQEYAEHVMSSAVLDPKRWFRPSKWGSALRRPLAQKVEADEEKKFAQEFAHMSKNEVAAQAVHLEKMTGKEGRRRRAALVTVAAQKGYLDDIMGHGHFLERYADPERTYTDPKGNTVRVHGKYYSHEKLNRFLHDYLGDSQEALRTIYNVGDIGKSIGHWEYYGHATYDAARGRHVALKRNPAIEDPTRDERYAQAMAEAHGEMVKVDQRKLQPSQVHTNTAMRFAPKRDAHGNFVTKKDSAGRDLLGPDGKPIVEIEVTSDEMDAFGAKATEIAYQGAQEGQLKQHTPPRNRIMMVANKEHIDPENGVMAGDSVMYERLKRIAHDFPSFLKIAWEQFAPTEYRDLFQFQEYDAQGKKGRTIVIDLGKSPERAKGPLVRDYDPEREYASWRKRHERDEGGPPKVGGLSKKDDDDEPEPPDDDGGPDGPVGGGGAPRSPGGAPEGGGRTRPGKPPPRTTGRSEPKDRARSGVGPQAHLGGAVAAAGAVAGTAVSEAVRSRAAEVEQNLRPIIDGLKQRRERAEAAGRRGEAARLAAEIEAREATVRSAAATSPLLDQTVDGTTRQTARPPQAAQVGSADGATAKRIATLNEQLRQAWRERNQARADSLTAEIAALRPGEDRQADPIRSLQEAVEAFDATAGDFNEQLGAFASKLDQIERAAAALPKANPRAVSDLTGQLSAMRQLVQQARPSRGSVANVERFEWIRKLRELYDNALKRWERTVGAGPEAASAQRRRPPQPPPPSPMEPPDEEAA